MSNETLTRAPDQRVSTMLYIGLFALLQVLIVVVAFIGGYLFRNWDTSRLPFSLPAWLSRQENDFLLVNEVLDLLHNNAYNDLPTPKTLEYGMIRGLLQAVNDPYTVFVEPPQHELQTNQLQGKFGGIGVRIERDAEQYVYLYPFPGSPAFQSGIRDADRLLQVGNMVVTPQTSNDDIQAAVRGPVGETVTITVGRAPDYAPQVFTITRAEVPLPSVTWNLVPDEDQVGVVHIHLIADTTPDEVTAAVKDLQAQGAERFVIDVRNNGGGLVDAGVETARLFLKSGTVIEQQYRGKPVKSFTVTRPGALSNLPIVVLINRGTASAAEIFAGALQAQQRATVVGTRSYGKDTIQLVFNLSDGSSLHVTSAKWWVPNLEPAIGGSGIQPDIAVPDEAPEGEGLLKAVETVLGLP